MKRLHISYVNGIIFWHEPLNFYPKASVTLYKFMENVKVLVVDDDPMTCSLLETILQMENYETVSASSIENVLALLEQEKPHILILDFHLGSKETLEQVPIIRADANWRHLPILMTSAIDRRKDCLEAGASGFILKPFNWQEMTKIINKIRDDLLG